MEMNRLKIKSRVVAIDKLSQKTRNKNLVQNISMQQTDPRIAMFLTNFNTMDIDAILELTAADAAILNTIQDKIRKKLRILGVTPS